MSKFKHLARMATDSQPRLSRRGFMIGATATGFTLAFVPAALLGTSPARAMSENRFEPTAWYSIDHDGIVSVSVAEAEMGQHVGTALARIVADELEVDWENVRLDYVDATSAEKHGYRVTGGSWSVWQNFDLLSRAGAAGRQVLIEEGARLLGEKPTNCWVKGSAVVCGNASISYGDVVRRGNLTRTFTDDELAQMPIKAPGERRYIGAPADALDIPDKVNGKTVYGIDATLPGMVYAKPILPPTRYGSTVSSVDDSGAKSIAGYQQTLVLDDPSGNVPGWALVIADSYHAAMKAARQIKIDYDAGETADVSEQDILDRGWALIESDEGSMVLNDDGVDEAFENAANVLSADYTTSTALHFQLEPVNALAVKRDDGIYELHTGNQWQSLALPWYAEALGVPADKIVMKTYLLGGGFGRRLNGDYGVPALLATKALGKPVKVVLSREDDSRFDSVRSASAQRVSMAMDSSGKVTAMQHHAAAGWPTEVMAPFFMGTGTNGVKFDGFAINGANHWYSVGAHRVRAISNDVANKTFRPGWLRSVGPGWTNWASESFMDEAAHALGKDPLAFRLEHLKAEGRNAGSAPNAVGGANRLANVLKRAADKANWGKSMPKNKGMGVASTFGQERAMPTWCACIAEVTVDPDAGKVTLDKLTLVLDAGTIVHPDGALAQTEGAALWGVSLALHEGTQFENGEVAARNLDRYSPLRMADVPDMDIEFVDSTEQAVGLGEPATTVVGPAIANAIFNAVGARVRDLPITPDAVKRAMT